MPKRRKRERKRVIVETVARVHLLDWLARPDNSRAKLARGVGVSHVTVGYWADGTARPEAHHRTALERITTIVLATDWLTPGEREIAEGPDQQTKEKS